MAQIIDITAIFFAVRFETVTEEDQGPAILSLGGLGGGLGGGLASIPRTRTIQIDTVESCSIKLPIYNVAGIRPVGKDDKRGVALGANAVIRLRQALSYPPDLDLYTAEDAASLMARYNAWTR
jgi:hypothetical protein